MSPLKYACLLVCLCAYALLSTKFLFTPLYCPDFGREKGMHDIAS